MVKELPAKVFLFSCIYYLGSKNDVKKMLTFMFKGNKVYEKGNITKALKYQHLI